MKSTSTKIMVMQTATTTTVSTASMEKWCSGLQGRREADDVDVEATVDDKDDDGRPGLEGEPQPPQRRIEQSQGDTLSSTVPSRCAMEATTKLSYGWTADGTAGDAADDRAAQEPCAFLS